MPTAAETRLAELLEVVETPTNKLITIGTIRDECGLTPEQYGLVRGTLETAIATLKADADPVQRMKGIDLQDALSAMLAGGISLSGDDRQSTIDLLATFGQWPDTICDAVKSLGVSRQPRWQTLGYQTEPTTETAQAEIDKEAMLQAYRDAHSAHIASVLDGDSPTIANVVAGLRAAADAMEAI